MYENALKNVVTKYTNNTKFKNENANVWLLCKLKVTRLAVYFITSHRNSKSC